MKNSFKRNFSGFTLIELLVVVLIIGILAGIAVPQYQKAVGKARVMSALPFLKAVTDAKERYFIANGTYAPDFDLLDIDIPYTSVTEYGESGNKRYLGTPVGGLSSAKSSRSVYWGGDGLGLTIDWHGNYGSCYSSSGEKGDKICASLGTKTNQQQQSTGAFIYKLQF